MQILTGLFKKIDLYLLTRFPVLWVAKIHYVILIGGTVSIAMISTATFLPISLSSNLPNPNPFFIYIPTILYFIVGLVMYIYLQPKFNLGTNYGFKSRLYEFQRALIYLFVIVLLYLPFFSYGTILNFRISSLFAPQQKTEILERQNKLAYTYNTDDKNMKQIFKNFTYLDEKTSRIKLSSDIDKTNFQELDQFNKIYGGSNLYSSQEEIIQSYYYGIEGKDNEFLNFINVLDNNIYIIHSAFSSHTEIVISIITTSISLFVLSYLILIFSSIYQYFGLKIILIGSLFNILFSLLTGGICKAYTHFISIIVNYYMSYSFIYIYFVYLSFIIIPIVLIWWIHNKVRNLKFRSTFHIILAQYFIPLVPLVMTLIIFHIVAQIANVDVVNAAQHYYDILRIFIILIWYFLYVPYLKSIFYKLFLLPQKV